MNVCSEWSLLCLKKAISSLWSIGTHTCISCEGLVAPRLCLVWTNSPVLLTHSISCGQTAAWRTKIRSHGMSKYSWVAGGQASVWALLTHRRRTVFWQKHWDIPFSLFCCVPIQGLDLLKETAHKSQTEPVSTSRMRCSDPEMLILWVGTAQRNCWVNLRGTLTLWFYCLQLTDLCNMTT